MNTAPLHPALTVDARIPVAATLYLLSQYAHRPCPLIAHAIAEQLAHLSQACSDDPSRVLKKLADTLLPQWQQIACGSVAVRH
jgi:hypothetical protein